jgi:hypothetical protein
MRKHEEYEDPVIAVMKKHNIPVTRENYLEIICSDDTELGAELENTLPPELQDFSKLKGE